MYTEVAKQAAAAFLTELQHIGDGLGLDIPLVKQAQEDPEVFLYLADLLRNAPLTQQD